MSAGVPPTDWTNTTKANLPIQHYIAGAGSNDTGIISNKKAHRTTCVARIAAPKNNFTFYDFLHLGCYFYIIPALLPLLGKAGVNRQPQRGRV
jgi:hypothetical protein